MNTRLYYCCCQDCCGQAFLVAAEEEPKKEEIDLESEFLAQKVEEQFGGDE